MARDLLLSLASGLLLSLAFPEPDLWPLAWVAIAPLLAVTARAPARRALATGFAFGLGFFGSLLVWISIVGWVAWAVLVVMESLYLGLFAAGWSWLSRGPRRWARLSGAAALWVLMEVARGSVPVVGFAWGELAQSQHDVAWALDPAAWGGRLFVSFLLVLFNGLVAEMLVGEPSGERVARGRLSVAALVLIVVILAIPGPVGSQDPLRVAIVQGGVPRDYTGTAASKDLEITRSHVTLTAEAATTEPDLVVWPESSVGIDPERVGEVGGLLAEASNSAGVPMIVGGNTERDDGRYQVMAFLVSDGGMIIDRYQKVHLVPFGEYVPNRAALDFIPMLDQVPRDAVPGDDVVIFDIAGGKVAPVISFEGDFGSLVSGRIAAGGRLLVVATNTSTWEGSWASAQHVAMSQVRAAENRVWTVHAALSGISAFIRPDGSVVRSLPLWTEATATEEVAFVSEGSPYSRLGDMPFMIFLFGLLVFAGIGSRADRLDDRPEQTGTIDHSEDGSG